MIKFEAIKWVFCDNDYLAYQIDGLDGSGVVVSHNDICNANWLITADQQIYRIELDSMSLDDPASNLAALLWWYYPPELHPRFLEIAGYKEDEHLRYRMGLRMAIHCLEILLPRDNSFDRFDPDNFGDNLSDFKAIIAEMEASHVAEMRQELLKSRNAGE